MRLTQRCALVGFTALLAVAIAVPAIADTVTTSKGTGLNLFPFNDYSAGGEYQEIYSASDFSGLTNFSINSIAFASGDFGSTGARTYDIQISMATTSTPVNNPSTTFASNEGPDFTTVFSGNLNATLTKNNTFDLVFPTTPFSYDPTAGNLLVDIVNISGNPSADDAFLTAGSDANRVYLNGGVGPAVADDGVTNGQLYTQFTTIPSVQNTPEPSGLVSFLVGFAGVGLFGLIARRRASAKLS